MSVELLLSRLDGVKRTGPGKWMARSPCRKDRTPSLSIRVTEDDRTLIHDFGGSAPEEVLSALGLTFSDLYPESLPNPEGYRSIRRPWIPADVFDAARLEIGVVAIIACDMHAKRDISEADYERLMIARGRLEEIAEAAYGR